MQEKEHDRMIMLTLYTDVCDKAKSLKLCPLNDQCLKAHPADSQVSLRRYPLTKDNSQLRYIAALCPLGEQCPRKENCSLAHTSEEIKYHPTQYKTEMCATGQSAC